MKKYQQGFTAPELFVLVLGVLGFGGWVANIWKIAVAISDPISGLFVLRAIGIVVAPLGAVLGYF